MINFSVIFVIFWLVFIFTLSEMNLSLDSFNAIKYCFFSFFVFIVLGILYSWWISKKVLHTQYISDTITLKKVALDNNLKFDKSNKKELLQSFEDKFFIFQQGNHYRQLMTYIKGEHQNKYSYHYVHFHYVDKHTSTSTDANENQSSNTTYSHYDLYGVMVPFDCENFIKVSNCENMSNVIQWKTSSISFNKKFEVYTDNEQAVAIFLQPKVIEQIENLYETFPELDIEISPRGLLVLSTPAEELLNCTRKYGVDQLDLFENEIKQTLEQSKFYKALEFINFLKEYHEQN